MTQPPNWSDLPVEMMHAIIEQMDFETKKAKRDKLIRKKCFRMRMRRTARLEKEIVESKKTDLKGLQVCGTRDGFVVYVVDPQPSPGLLSTAYKGSPDKILSLITSLLLFAKIQVFSLSGEESFFTEDTHNFLEKLIETRHFQFPAINVQFLNADDFHTLLEVCPVGTELFDFFGIPTRALERVCRDPLTLPVILGANIIQFDERDAFPANIIVYCWIVNDQNIGKKVLIHLGLFKEDDAQDRLNYEADSVEEELFEQFKYEFSEDIISEGERTVRIKTNNNEKHVVMRIVEEKEEDSDNIRVVAVWEMISAELNEKDYPKTTGYMYTDEP